MSLSTSERSFLKGLRIFEKFSDEERTEIAGRFSSHPLAKDEALFRTGEDGLACYILLRGRLCIWLDEKEKHEEVARVMPGEIFGHIALLDGGPRSATCIADENSIVLELSIFDFAALISPGKAMGFKLLRALTEVVVNQMRSTNQVLTRLAIIEESSENPRPPTSPELLQSMQDAAGMTFSSNLEDVDLDNVEVVVSEADQYRQYNRKG